MIYLLVITLIFFGLCRFAFAKNHFHHNLPVATWLDIIQCTLVGFREGLKKALWLLEERYAGWPLVCIRLPLLGDLFICLGQQGSLFFHKNDFAHLKVYKRFLRGAIPKKIVENLEDRMRIVKKAASPERFSDLFGITQTIIEEFFDELPSSGSLDLFEIVGKLVYYMELAAFVGPFLKGAQRNKFIELFRQVDLEALFHSPMEAMFPVLAERKIKNILLKLRDLVKEVYLEQQRNPFDDNPSFLDTVVAECTKNGEVDWDAVYWDVHTMIVAGQTNTYTTAAWVLYYIDKNPAAKSKLLSELAKADSSDDPYTMIDQFKGMLYVEQCVREVVRLSMEFIELRGTSEDMTYDHNGHSFRLPTDSLLIFAPVTLHKRPDIFKDPMSFVPERHQITKDHSLDIKMIRDCKLAVWGCGWHPCPGMKLANLQIKMMLWYITKYLDFSVETEELKTRIMPGVVRPATPIMINYRKKLD